MQFGGQGGRTRNAEPQAGQFAHPIRLHQAVVERGYPEEERGIEGRSSVQNLVGVEAREDHGAGPSVKGAVKPDAESVHVEEGQGENQSVIGGPAPGQAKGLHAR